MKNIQHPIKSSALALLTMLLPCSLIAGPTVVRIDASHEGAPTTAVFNSEDYNTYVGPLVSNQAAEYGALINLPGLDNWYLPPYNSVIPDQGWRFTDPKAADQTHSAVYIVWIDHDYYGPFYNGDLRIGFNQKKPGHGYYPTPGPTPSPGADVNAGPIRSEWVTLYADETLVLQFKGFKLNAGQK